MSRTRAYVSTGRRESLPEPVIEALARGRVAPTKGRSREAFPESHIEVAEEQAPPEFGAPLFQDTLLRMLICVLENLSQGTPYGAYTSVKAHTPGQQ
ncbi:hypothetical protein KY290_033850 [Solanum tuberosum]|uniref:Uncharacterized protein n=1 Tax=Solanum tuberosum TaxID=4113 RepID=A0ABQ7U3E7_SOLTU|nr:hypothetical protein KY290_033850 [Solanum tuberosum]